MADADWYKYKQLRGKALPESFDWNGRTYRLHTLFKQDFYAATGRYTLRDGLASASHPTSIILKIYHTDPCWKIPLHWLGMFLCNREVSFYEQTADLHGLPRFLARYGESGFIREYVPGVHLREYRKMHQPTRRFYDDLEDILAGLHARGISHNDLSKPENILVKPDGSPVLIDLQIATNWEYRFPLLKWAGKHSRAYMQSIDRFHIRKHRRRDRPEDFSPEELAKAKKKGILLNLHGWVLRKPYRAVRHFILQRFMRVGTPVTDMESSRSTDVLPPARAA